MRGQCAGAATFLVLRASLKTLLVLVLGFAKAEDGPEPPKPAEAKGSLPPARPKGDAVRSGRADKQPCFALPAGATGDAWRLYIQNDAAKAEQAFQAVLAREPASLEALEGLRACFLLTGRLAEMQALNLRMIAAAARQSPAQIFVRRALEAQTLTASRAEMLACFAATAPQAAPCVRAALMDALASLHQELDRTAEAEKCLAETGCIDRWLWVAGPFGQGDPNNPLERRFAPERSLKRLDFLDERGRAVAVSDELPAWLGYLELTRLLPETSSRHPGVHYAFTNLESERRQEVILSVQGPAAVIFLHGLRIHQEPREPRFPRWPILLRTRLLEGPNALLVKMLGTANLQVRVLAPDYSPAKGVSVKPISEEARERQSVRAVPGFLFAAETVGAPAEHFQARLPEKERGPEGLAKVVRGKNLSLPEALWLLEAAEEENDSAALEVAARMLADSYPDSAGLLDFAADALLRAGAGHAEARFAEEARRWRAHALTCLPDSLPHLLALGRFHQEHGMAEQELEQYRRAAEAHPRSALAHFLLAEASFQRGREALALQHFERAAELDRAFLPRLAEFLHTDGDRPRARRLHQELLRLGMIGPWRSFFRWSELGDWEEAGKALAQVETAYLCRPEAWLGLRAKLLLDQGRRGEALQLLLDRARRFPDRRGFLAELAEAALRAGDRPTARQALESILARHPDDYPSRLRLRELEGRAGERWWEPYDVKTESLDAAQFTQEKYPQSNHAWIVDFMVVRVRPDLGRESYTHIARKVLNQEGIDQLADSIPRGRNLLFVRTLNPDGSSHQPENIQGLSLQALLSTYKVVPGSIIEYAHLDHEEADQLDPELHLGFNFNHLDAPRALSRWVVILPKDHKLEIRRIRPELVEEQILPGPEEDCITYQWTNKQVEGIKQELLMPEEQDQEVIPLVFINTPERPRSATRLLAQPERLFVPEGAARQARELARQAAPAAAFSRIVEWVRRNIRTGTEARSLEDVWELRAGNAMQMNDLASAMCRAAGLQVSQAWVNALYLPGRNWVTKNARRQWEPFVFSAFGGARLLVLEPPGQEAVWLSLRGPEPRHWEPAHLSAEETGALALIRSEEAARIKIVRGEALGRIAEQHCARFRLDGQGHAVLSVSVGFHGLLAGQLRRILSDPRQADRIRQAIARRLWPRLAPNKIEIENQNDTAQPLRCLYEGSIRNAAARAGATFQLSPFPQRAGLLNLAGPAQREHDLLIKPERADEFLETDLSITYEAPEGHAWIETPEDLFLCSEFGFYLADFNVKGRTLTCARAFLLPPQRITPEQYPRFLQFLRRIDETEGQRIGFGPLDFPEFKDLARPVLSGGYAGHGYE